MKRAIIGTLLFSISICALVAQNAIVVQLSDADAKQAMAKWEDLQDAQKDWNQFNRVIEKKYLQVTIDSPDKGDFVWGSGNIISQQDKLYVRSGFEHGFTFSKDFRFLVPKPAATITNSPWIQLNPIPMYEYPYIPTVRPASKLENY